MSGPLRVHFDQNCMNARGVDRELRRIQMLHDAGAIELVANVRNRIELGRSENASGYNALARARLAEFEESPEVFRLDVSPLDLAVLGSGDEEALNPSKVWNVVFPNVPFPVGGGNVFDKGQNSIHDVMHIMNAHDAGAAVLLTRENALLNGRERLYSELGLKPRIESPAEFLLRLPTLPEDCP